MSPEARRQVSKLRKLLWRHSKMLQSADYSTSLEYIGSINSILTARIGQLQYAIIKIDEKSTIIIRCVAIPYKL